MSFFAFEIELTPVKLYWSGYAEVPGSSPHHGMAEMSRFSFNHCFTRSRCNGYFVLGKSGIWIKTFLYIKKESLGQQIPMKIPTKRISYYNLESSKDLFSVYISTALKVPPLVIQWCPCWPGNIGAQTGQCMQKRPDLLLLWIPNQQVCHQMYLNIVYSWMSMMSRQKFVDFVTSNTRKCFDRKPKSVIRQRQLPECWKL